MGRQTGPAVTALRIILLLVGVFGVLARPARLPPWALPVVAVAVELAAGIVSPDGARVALAPLWAPIGFVLAAVPLAVLLDRLGFFSSVAVVLLRSGGRRGSDTSWIGRLWLLGAGVTALLNLDAGVVLLTPLYVGIARRSGRDPLALALAPVLLACLASSLLPVSNLTNLIASAQTGAGSGAFLANLGLPSVAAIGVGWLGYRRFVIGGAAAGGGGRAFGGGGDRGVAASGAAGVDRGVVDRRAVAIGGVLVALVVTGFVAGHTVGIEPWVVALAGDGLLLVADRVVPGRDGKAVLPEVRSVPVGTALVALSLGVLASAAASGLHVDRLIAGTSTLDLARAAGVAALGANVLNNLPALLVTLPTLGHQASPRLWAVLLGVNMGPLLVVTGSLASLLWLETLGRLGVPVRPRDFTRAGVVVGLPAAVAAGAVYLVIHAFGWG